MFKRIIFAHNATPASERALLYLEYLARIEESEVIVLHVYHPPERYNDTKGYTALLEQMESVVYEVVNDAVEHLQKSGISALGMVRAGNPARIILETVESEQASLVVLGTRGPSNMTDILLGDVATEVLRYVRCPVFLVP